VQHLDRLHRCRIVRVFGAKLFGDTPCFHLGRIDLEKLGDGDGLLGGQEPLPKLGFAEVRLIHLGGGGNDPQREFLALAQLAKPFSKRGWGLSLSSHLLARYSEAENPSNLFSPDLMRAAAEG
jgi:hypothetical protein